MIDNISKSLRKLISKGGESTKTKVAIAIVFAIIATYTVIKKTISKETISKIKEYIYHLKKGTKKYKPEGIELINFLDVETPDAELKENSSIEEQIQEELRENDPSRKKYREDNL